MGGDRLSSLFDCIDARKVTILARTIFRKSSDFYLRCNRAKIELLNLFSGGRIMPRRKRINKQQPKKKMNWTTTVWYIIGALIVMAMGFSLVAGAFR
jgi:hypothetical protein